MLAKSITESKSKQKIIFYSIQYGKGYTFHLVWKKAARVNANEVGVYESLLLSSREPYASQIPEKAKARTKHRMSSCRPAFEHYAH